MTTQQDVVIALSGGVDSAVAAFLLQEQGYRVSAIFMNNWVADADEHCPARIDYCDAQQVCEHLRIKLEYVDFAEEYWAKVFSRCLDLYNLGITPNPDIWCNKEIKFGVLLRYAQQLGASLLATGHYAQLAVRDGVCHLSKASDPNKDQSYFLYALTQAQLSSSLFPLGAMHKTAVRQLARRIGLPNHAKKDSVGICFIGQRNFKTFLQDYLPTKPGAIFSVDGAYLGEHDGLMFYTIGQRQGIGSNAASAYYQHGPWYIVAKNIADNTIIVAPKTHPSLYSTQLLAHDLHWLNQETTMPLHCTAKIRFRQADQECAVAAHPDGCVVKFAQPQTAITPGQAIVFYQDDLCLGGATITAAC